MQFEGEFPNVPYKEERGVYDPFIRELLKHA